MKKIVLLTILSAIFIGCGDVKEGEFTIEGQAKGVDNGN